MQPRPISRATACAPPPPAAPRPGPHCRPAALLLTQFFPRNLFSPLLRKASLEPQKHCPFGSSPPTFPDLGSSCRGPGPEAGRPGRALLSACSASMKPRGAQLELRVLFRGCSQAPPALSASPALRALLNPPPHLTGPARPHPPPGPALPAPGRDPRGFHGASPKLRARHGPHRCPRGRAGRLGGGIAPSCSTLITTRMAHPRNLLCSPLLGFPQTQGEKLS